MAKRIRIDPHVFIKAWQEAKSVQEVVEKLKLPDTKRSRQRVYTRAHAYRKKGVDLKRFPRSSQFGGAGNALDWATLASFAEHCLPDKGGE